MIWEGAELKESNQHYRLYLLNLKYWYFGIMATTYPGVWPCRLAPTSTHIVLTQFSRRHSTTINLGGITANNFVQLFCMAKYLDWKCLDQTEFYM